MNKNLFKIGTILWERGQNFFFLFLLPQNFLRSTNVAMEDNEAAALRRQGVESTKVNINH